MWGRARISRVFLTVACVPSPGLGANALDTATNIDIGTNEIGASPAQFELPAFDKTLSRAGRIALWTEGDSCTRFDSISIIPLPASEESY
jgi:hypothetical protein